MDMLMLKQAKTFYWIFFSLISLIHLTETYRQISPALIILKLSYFGKKRFMKNGSFKNFWFVGSRNWFVIHESGTLNSDSDILQDCSSVRIDSNMNNKCRSLSIVYTMLVYFKF